MTDKIETMTDKIETMTDKIETMTDKIETMTDKIETMTDKIETMTDRINIALMGGVNAGKSTTLNSISGQTLAHCHFRRATMVPVVYVETETNTCDRDAVYRKISQKNKEIIEKTEAGEQVPKEEYGEMTFGIGKLDMKISDEATIAVYDIPGLNDLLTSQIYYDYLDSSFHKFNIVIFFVDIRSGLNTSDEYAILDFITTMTKHQRDNNGRDIYTLVVVNKADDMQLKPGTDEVMVTGELQEMFDHVHRTVSDEFRRKSIEKQLIGIIPLCAYDAYLYGMVKKFGDDFKLTPEQILKIGTNETGKRFSTFTPEEQSTKVYHILNDTRFVETMIQLSGFGKFEQILKKFLLKNDNGKRLRIDNILYELKSLTPITRDGYRNMLSLRSLIKQYTKVYKPLERIDENMYIQYMQEFVDKLVRMFEAEILVITEIQTLMEYYDTFIDTIMKPDFSEYYDVEQYSICLKMHAKTILMRVFERAVQEDQIIDVFCKLDKIGLFTQHNVSELFACLYTNPRKQHTITAFNDDSTELIKLLERCAEYDVTKVLRFILINRFESKTRLYDRYLMYRVQDEIVMSTYIQSIMPAPTVEMILSEIDIQHPMYALDRFYLQLSRQGMVSRI
jgi:GTP-binding protein EngB required for normal cell division